MKDILVVEDNFEMGTLLCDFLDAEGFSVDWCKNGEDALEHFQNNGAKIILLDIMLPKLNGFEVCRKIRENSNAPIIMVSAKIAKDDKLNGLDKVNLNDFPNLLSIEKYSGSNDFYNKSYSYEIREINGNIYRFDYILNSNNSKIIIFVNIILAVISITIIVLLLVVYFSVIKPFNKISYLPYELAKGNLTMPLKENKNKFFGKFVWGLDLLREKLEENKNKDIEYQKDKMTLLMSISHDIKTPLGIIELYSKALEKKLYKDEAKQNQVLHSINEKCDEIKNYVNQLIESSNTDVLSLNVENTEFYTKELLDNISEFYSDKLNHLNIDFYVNNKNNYLVKGDFDRSVEIMQNIIENAIKYGDGKSISINISKEEEYAIVSIKNSGCNLENSELQNIFQSFWRGSNAKNIKGNGLGLYICKELITKMDGQIFAEKVGSYLIINVLFVMC